MSGQACPEHDQSAQAGCGTCLDAWGTFVDADTVLGWLRSNEVILLVFPRDRPEDADDPG